MNDENTFFGKYRGIVTNVRDPLMMGRIKAKVPDVLGIDHESGWAMPCAHFSGNGVGFFTLPSVSAGVWIEFEHGDPDYPVWSGGWWGAKSEMPPTLSLAPEKKVMIITDGGHSFLLDDTPGTGGITLQTAGGMKIMLSDNGIVIDNGQGASIELTGKKVLINDGTLEVE